MANKVPYSLVLLVIFMWTLSVRSSEAEMTGGDGVIDEEQTYTALNLCRPLDEKYYEDKERGWFFKEYCRKKRKIEEAEKKKSGKKDTDQKEKLPPIDWVKVQDPDYLNGLNTEEFKELYERVKDEVVYRPDQHNMLAYLRLQDYMKEKAMTFSYVWRDVLLEHPELDPTIQNPTTSFGVHIKTKYENENRKRLMADIKENIGLFFFVSGDCPYCHEEAGIIRSLMSDYGVTIRTMSKDHCGYGNFAYCSVEPQLFEIFNIQTTPSLIAVIRGKDGNAKFQPIASGLVTEEEIVNRLLFYYNFITTGQRPG